jgi:hypothetical protein
MNQPSEPVYPIPETLFKAVVDYMSSRPWREVGGAMPQLLAIEATKPAKAKEQPK